MVWLTDTVVVFYWINIIDIKRLARLNRYVTAEAGRCGWMCIWNADTIYIFKHWIDLVDVELLLSIDRYVTTETGRCGWMMIWHANTIFIFHRINLVNIQGSICS